MTPSLQHSRSHVDLQKEIKVTKIYINIHNVPVMYQCKFDLNPFIDRVACYDFENEVKVIKI